MLRFDPYGRALLGRRLWPSKPISRQLYAYSPYHSLKSGHSPSGDPGDTADTDDRVVPEHTFKYTAAIQHADIGDKPGTHRDAPGTQLRRKLTRSSRKRRTCGRSTASGRVWFVKGK